jgi:oxygen-independent coproporphyrinogen-3 oxidase
VKHPRAYLENAGAPQRVGGDNDVPAEQLPFEYMLNALRLIDGVPMDDFAGRTGLPPDAIRNPLRKAVARGWFHDDESTLRTTELGQRFLNDVIELFMS